jgi:plasmid maintenance system antidote protein VapI
MLSLKYMIRNYIRSDQHDSNKGFAFFLKEYIRRQDKKNSEFAKEISISAVELSQLVNKHRDPNLKIIVRLAAHSNQNFPAIMWFNLYSKDKTVELLENEKLRETQKKYVKKVLGFEF